MPELGEFPHCSPVQKCFRIACGTNYTFRTPDSCSKPGSTKQSLCGMLKNIIIFMDFKNVIGYCSLHFVRFVPDFPCSLRFVRFVPDFLCSLCFVRFVLDFSLFLPSIYFTKRSEQNGRKTDGTNEKRSELFFLPLRKPSLITA